MMPPIKKDTTNTSDYSGCFVLFVLVAASICLPEDLVLFNLNDPTRHCGAGENLMENNIFTGIIFTFF